MCNTSRGAAGANGPHDSCIDPPTAANRKTAGSLWVALWRIAHRGVRSLTLGAFLVGTAISANADAQANNWRQIDDEDGVKVHSKDIPNSPLVAFRGETVISAPLGKLLWVLADNTHRTAWVDRLQRSIVLEARGPYDYIVYQHFSLPFPISDRDYVYRGHAKRGKGGSVVLEMQSVDHPKAPATVGVRAHLVRSRYELIPQGANKTRVIVEVHTDPKGGLPSWLVNLIQESWPMKTLLALRAEVKKPHVGTLTVPTAP